MSEVRIQRRQPTALLRVTAIARLLLVGGGAISVILGLLFWGGIAYPLLPLHMLVGLGVTIALITLVIVAWVAGVGSGLAVLALIWSVVVPVLGYTQTRLLPGSFHWIIEALHLLIGVGAIVLGQLLAARIRQALNS